MSASISASPTSSSSTFTNPFNTSTPAPGQTANSNTSSAANTDNAGSFYKNLFYILIGLLAAFGVVSFLSLMRARRRRRAILREAERLGVMVPGVPGYIPIRERRTMNWTRSDGTDAPVWWEVGPREKEDQQEERIQQAKREDRFMPGESAFQPLSIVPPAEPLVIEPIEVSPLPYFPNHLAYRESAYRPPPSRFQPSDPESLNSLRGEHLDLVTIIRMPFESGPESPTRARQAQADEDDEDDPEAVFREWAGIELGIQKVQVERR